MIAGGKRPGHTLMPVLVRRDGRIVGVHGTMGGSAQAQIHAQLLLRTARGEAPADAVAAPRFVVGGLGVGGHDRPWCWPRDGAAIAERAAWSAAGFEVHALADFDEEAGHAQMIRIGAEGAFRVATDPRCDGAALAG